MLESATGRKAYHVGKPNPFMMREARKKIGLSTDEVIMVGDTMDTDIRGATDLSFQSILVLTGSTTLQTLSEYPFRPTRVVNSIAELVPKGWKSRQRTRFSEDVLLHDTMPAL